MMPLNDRFFSRGGFSSSRFDDAGASEHMYVTNDLDQVHTIREKKIAMPYKTGQNHVRTKYGLSS